MKELLDNYAEKDMNVRIFTECSILRFAEHFQDDPKGVLIFHREQDNPFEFRKALPNVAIMGGMTTDMLSNGTPEECITYAKRLCDELVRSGGFSFSEGKMLSYSVHALLARFHCCIGGFDAVNAFQNFFNAIFIQFAHNVG